MTLVVDRVISVRLRIAVAEARRDAKAAADAIRGIADAAEKAGNSTAGLTRLGVAAAAAAKATASVGAVATGGIAAMTAAVVKGGVAYNQLEQTSRAALTTLLGSAAAATNQMAALREFGKTSPFPRQVWITAQQQLLAFGMQAEKIIPTFQAIQDAVAAAGGSGQTIAEITQIIAKIQSTGKVTAEELNELGYRGIDAASLIGEAMGKTAGEVRADITAQAISGVQFIDMLTGAMSQRFEGAAAGVKATWAGATDRIKGAIRDIGGLLASPLVDPEGGGAAVDWANSIADALRALESRLEPAMAALRDRAEPALDAFNDQLQELADWIRTADFGAIVARIQPMLPAIAGVTAGIVTMGARSLPIIGGMVSGLKPFPVALAAAAASSPELRRALLDLLDAAQPLLEAAAKLTATLASALGPALSAVAAILQPVIATVGFLADRFADLPSLIQMVVVGLVAWKALGLGTWLTQNVAALTRFSEQMKVQQALAAMSGQQIGTMGAAYSVAATKVSGAASKISGAAGGIRSALTGAVGFLGGPWGAAIGLGITALTAFSAAQDDAAGSANNFTYQIDTQTGALSRSSIADLYKHIAEEAKALGDESVRVSEILPLLGLSVDDVIGYLLGEEDAIEKVNKALEVNNSWSNQLQTWLGRQSTEIQNQIKVQTSAAGAADRYAGANEDVANAAANAAGTVGGLTGSLYGAGDAADSVTTRAQQLNTVLSELYDAQFAAQEASDGFQGKLHSLRNAFSGNDKAASKSAASNNSYGDALRRQQKIIRDTAEQLEDLAEAQRRAEQEAAEAAKSARQRQLDELFGKQFDVQSTMDAFQSALAQASKDLADGTGVAGSRSLLGFTEGALANREKMRSIVQAAQAAIQAERDSGASGERLGQVSAGLADQLAQQAAAWGLSADEVRQYTDAIRSFGNLAGQEVVVDLASVRAEFAEQRKEIQENSAEQMENARQSAASAVAHRDAGDAVDYHTATLEGNSEAAIKNRDLMRDLVKAGQEDLTQLHLSGAGREELIARGEELATQLEQEAIALGFTKEDVQEYTEAVRLSALEISRFPILSVRADIASAMTTITNFVLGVNDQLAKIQKRIEIKALTGMEWVNSMGGGKNFLTNADGGLINGRGGPREDNILSWVSSGEYIINARDTARNLPLLERINRGEDVRKGLPGFAAGGYVDPVTLHYLGEPSTGLEETYNAMMKALAPVISFAQGPLAWAAAQVGKPYLWGGVGPAGYDCSGFMSAITNVIQGRGPHARRFATGSFPTGDFAKGPGNFMIGSFRGNPGHMAGTLMGVNVESRGSDGVVMGKRARGAGDGLFGGNIWHLKGYADGGLVGGDPPFDLLSPRGLHWDDMVKGSYASGTDYVPMDGLYRLHKGEAVTPAAQNAGGVTVIELRSDGTKFMDLVVDALNKADGGGQVRFVRKR